MQELVTVAQMKRKASHYFKFLPASMTLGALGLMFAFNAEAADQDVRGQQPGAPVNAPVNKHAFIDKNKPALTVSVKAAHRADLAAIKMKDARHAVRELIVTKASSYLDVREQGGDNQGRLIDEFLQANKTGVLPRTQAAPAGSPWCAGFTSHVLEHVSPDLLRYSVVSKNLMWQTQHKGAYSAVGNYTPKPGDLVFFERGKDGDWRGHVGIVATVDQDGTITTIEGNKAHPDYQGDPHYKYDPKKPDGVRKVTYKPEEFKAARILGFGDVSKMITPQIADQIMDKILPQKKISTKKTPRRTPSPGIS